MQLASLIAQYAAIMDAVRTSVLCISTLTLARGNPPLWRQKSLGRDLDIALSLWIGTLIRDISCLAVVVGTYLGMGC